MIKGSQILIDSLIKEGVDTIFGYPGGSIMPLYDELYNYQEEINHVLVRHEQGAAHAAQGYARASGKPGVCMATAGPGATNLITGITDAYMDSTPIICITAQVPTDKLGSNFFQETDIINLTLSITKWSYQITSADEIAEVVAKAFHIASTGRPGPILLSITKNAQTTAIPFKNSKKYKFNIPSLRVNKLRSGDVNLAKGWIESAKKPLILAGQGVTIARGEEQLMEFAERSNIPVSVTLLGLSSFPTTHPLYVGFMGMHGNIASNFMIQEADLIIAAGMRFSDRVTGDLEKFAPNAKIIHIDIDRSEFNKTVKSHLHLHGDVAQVLAQLTPPKALPQHSEWLQFMEKNLQKERELVIDRLFDEKGSNKITMAQLVERATHMCGGDQIIVTDVGQHQMFCARYSKFTKGRSLISSGGLGTMGFGLPAAIGAKLGAPDRVVIAVLGDGGFQMTMQELGTIMQGKIDVKVVVVNNSYLGMVRQWQELFFDKRYSQTHMDNPDFTMLAKAYGIQSRRVEKIEELDGALKEMFENDSSYLLEVIVEKEENVFPMVPLGSSINNMIYQ